MGFQGKRSVKREFWMTFPSRHTHRYAIMSKCWSECFPSKWEQKEKGEERKCSCIPQLLYATFFFHKNSHCHRTLASKELIVMSAPQVQKFYKMNHFGGCVKSILTHFLCEDVQMIRMNFLQLTSSSSSSFLFVSSSHYLSLSPFLLFFSYFPLSSEESFWRGKYVWSLLSFFLHSRLVFGFCVSFSKIHCYIIRHPHISIESNTCTWQRQITRDFRHTCHFLLSSYSSSLISLSSLCEKRSLSPSLSLPHDSFVIVLFDQCLCLSIIDQKSTSSFPCNLFHPLTPQVNKLREINVFSDFSGSRNESSSAWLSAIYIRDST